MAFMLCRQLTGTFASSTGWVGLIVATATNDWVRTCDYSVATCVRMDELGSSGLWAECVISPAKYHCSALNQILSLPAHIQTSRALMVSASLLGLPALLMVLMAMPCVRFQNDTSTNKLQRSRIGGALYIVMAVFGLISTIWFPIGAYQNDGIMSFGFSLYAGWVGVGLCLLGGIIILCCYGADPALPSRDTSFYYSRSRGVAIPSDQPAANHAKTAHV
ncbi:unnamed protein product [Knipowitschia caucasica]|uniref:Claudin n=1 Tax=Knipowitschia caucasica TaxID=637954 RepID=A0AAV2L834_KNICA